METNRKYKDTIFTSLFDDASKLIELYNAIFDTNYSNETKLEIITLKDVIFSKVKNDLAFLIDDKFVVMRPLKRQ